MSQQETFTDKYIFEVFSHRWPYNSMFVLSYLVQQNEEYMRGEKKEKKKKEIVLDASLVGIFPIFPTNFIMNTLLTTGHMNANRL